MVGLFKKYFTRMINSYSAKYVKLNSSSSWKGAFLMLCNTQLRLQECDEQNPNHLPLQCGLKSNFITTCKTRINTLMICGNKMPTRCNRGFYCRSYCLLNMFRASLCPSSGAQEYYTVVAACGILCCVFFK